MCTVILDRSSLATPVSGRVLLLTRVSQVPDPWVLDHSHMGVVPGCKRLHIELRHAQHMGYGFLCCSTP